MIQSTKGIVLRSVKYGDTSLILTVYTERYGIQHYMVQGVRSDKKGGAKANVLQPTSLLDMVVYHQPGKNLQRIKEFKPAYIYQGIQQEPLKNSVALFMVELAYRLITEEEAHPELFEFLYSNFMQLDAHASLAAANTPLVFSLRLCQQMGFGIDVSNFEEGHIFDIENGNFIPYAGTDHMRVSSAQDALELHTLLQEGLQFKTSGERRFHLLQLVLRFVQWHHPDMQALRSVDVLHAIWR
ncbi:MAG: DNA repair protein RecO [Chitinophagaceae bacterium]